MEPGAAGAKACRGEGDAHARGALPSSAKLSHGTRGAASGAAWQLVWPSLADVGHVVLKAYFEACVSVFLEVLACEGARLRRAGLSRTEGHCTKARMKAELGLRMLVMPVVGSAC